MPTSRETYHRAYRAAHKKELRAKDQLYRAVHREELKAKDRIYYATHKEKRVAYAKAHYAANKEKAKMRDVKRKYNLTESEHQSLLNKWDGSCAICSKSEWDRGGPCIDHDHATGRVRGIVCNICNLILGLIKDKSETARAIVKYLEGEDQK